MNNNKQYLHLNTYEFSEYCKNNSFKKYIFSTMNQDWENNTPTIFVSQIYSAIKVGFNPNRITLFNQNNSNSRYLDSRMTMSMVKYIDIEQDDVNTLLYIVCGNLNSSDIDVVYKIVCYK